MEEKGKVILITGASDGIGRETAKRLAEYGAKVILLCRNESKCRNVRESIVNIAGNRNVHYVIADLGCQEQIREVAKTVNENFNDLNVLINNAGVFSPHRKLTCEGIEYTFGVNHIGHFLLTLLLLKTLMKNAPSRIINVTSMVHSNYIDFSNLNMEKHYDPYEAYSVSKLANVLFTVELARKLKGTGVTVNCLHPGVINTKLLRAGWGPVGAPVKYGAETPVYLALSDEVEHITGKYFVGKRISEPAPISNDLEVAEKLWRLSEEMTGVKFDEIFNS